MKKKGERIMNQKAGETTGKVAEKPLTTLECELGDLATIINRLDDKFEALTARLEPVLSPSSPPGPDEAPSEELGVLRAQQIRVERQKLECLEYCMDQVGDRLQV